MTLGQDSIDFTDATFLIISQVDSNPGAHAHVFPRGPRGSRLFLLQRLQGEEDKDASRPNLTFGPSFLLSFSSLAHALWIRCVFALDVQSCTRGTVVTPTYPNQVTVLTRDLTSLHCQRLLQVLLPEQKLPSPIRGMGCHYQRFQQRSDHSSLHGTPGDERWDEMGMPKSFDFCGADASRGSGQWPFLKDHPPTKMYIGEGRGQGKNVHF